MKYYPGDEYVDWWAIDIFRIGSVESWNTVKFLEDAEAHKKPVMLSEVTPFTYDVTKNEGWDEWFVPFFEFVRDNPVIKSICYINWKWTDYPQWSNWGDARLERSTTIRERYSLELIRPDLSARWNRRRRPIAFVFGNDRLAMIDESPKRLEAKDDSAYHESR
ncbi:MAG: hypothetical protein MZU97_08445 [Bacillus subtilis]|nr:hypothetical protein [Bacillus subtilis]